MVKFMADETKMYASRRDTFMRKLDVFVDGEVDGDRFIDLLNKGASHLLK
jgi:hypothetical protein